MSKAELVFLLNEGGNFNPHPKLGAPRAEFFTSASSDMVFDKLSPLQFIDGGKAAKFASGPKYLDVSKDKHFIELLKHAQTNMCNKKV